MLLRPLQVIAVELEPHRAIGDEASVSKLLENLVCAIRQGVTRDRLGNWLTTDPRLPATTLTTSTRKNPASIARAA